jgi:sugar lactone lactonase YvrE
LTSPTLYSQSVYSQPYTFTTLAGNAGYGIADGPGSTARFNNPSGVARDGAGNLYVADSYNHTIRKITPAGEVSTLAGLAESSGSADGPGATARFYYPSAVAVDSAGNLYVADTYNFTIRKITPSGEVSTVAGQAGFLGSADGTGSNARFYYPRGVAVDSTGNLYVADTSNHTLRKITPAGEVSTLAGLAGASGSADGPRATARFYLPRGVAVDSTGIVYVADTENHTLRKVTPAGVVSTLAGVAGASGSADGPGTAARFYEPAGVAVDSAGNLCVADTYNCSIRTITSGGEVSTLAGQAMTWGSADGPGTAARFYHPSGVVMDSAGTIYVADTYNSTLRALTPGGVVSTLAGRAGQTDGVDGPGSNAHFYHPYDVAVDSAGNAYVADTDNHTLRKITPGGVVSTLAGRAGSQGSADGPGSEARFYHPASVAVDSTGTVYVADYGNNTLRKVTPGGEVSTLAGRAGVSGSADGPGVDARFYGPSGLAVDGIGNLYVADAGNHTIRKVTPAGEVSTLAGLARSYGSADGAGSNARFYYPSGVAVDSAGTVYVADYYNHTIRKVTPGGEVSTLAGQAGSWGTADGTGATARFYCPSGLAVDSAGTVYVADTDNHTLRLVTPAGKVSTLAGRVRSLGSADGTGSNAQFYYPSGVAVDSTGTLYVADTDNHTIRVGRLAPESPVLGIRLTGDQLILSWPLAASNFLVEASSTLSPAPYWLPLTNAVGTNQQGCVLTNSLETGARLFRLRLP